MAYSDRADYCWDDVLRFSEVIRYASPRLKRLLLEHIDKEMKWDYFHGLDGVPYCDITKAVDIGDSLLRWGPNYLYVWFDKNGIPFYAGKGRDTDRMAQVRYKTRSDAFKAKIGEGGCHSVMVAKHISDKHINTLERELIAYLYCAGFPLVNDKDIPPPSEVVMRNLFQGCRDAQKVSQRLGQDVSKTWGEFSERWDEMCAVYQLVDELIGTKWEGEGAALNPPPFKPQTVVYKGVEKTYAQWAKEPGVTVTAPAIKSRIEKGWSVEDAIFAPPIKHGPGQSMKERSELCASYRDNSCRA